jgi:hypothetical protein
LISANPNANGTTPTDAATIAAQNAAYGPINSKTTDLLPTHSVGAPCPAAQAVQRKNIAKVAVTAQIRTYAQNR